MHTPVLLQQVINALDVKNGRQYIDATVGEGGHTRVLLEKGGQVLGIDWDPEQVEKLKKELRSASLQLVAGNFADIETIAQENKFFPVDGILFDLGLSMAQLAHAGRGFSYKYPEEPLDMRIDVRGSETAADILNMSIEEELYDVLARYGEDVHSELLARKAVVRRTREKFKNVNDLMSLIQEVLAQCKVGHYHNTNDTARRVFQALRMQINHEVENLKSGLTGAVKLIKKNGRVAVITFHSIEDRIVKQFIREHNLQYVEELVWHKSPKPFEKSAKLRVFTKK